MSKLSNKVVLIVGASKGLGASLAVELARKGNELILVSRNEMALKNLTLDINNKGGRASFYICDISGSKTSETTYENILQNHPKIDCLITNAAVCELNDKYDFEAFERHLQTNLMGSVRAIMKFSEKFEAGGEGLIVSINSMLALTPVPLYQSYVAAKSGLRSYIQSLRISLRDTKIRCVNVYPAFIRTDMIANVTHPKPLEMTPEKMAQKIVQRLEWGLKEIYIPIPSGLLMRFAAIMPNFLYNRLFARRYFGRFFDIAKYHSSRVDKQFSTKP